MSNINISQIPEWFNAWNRITAGIFDERQRL
jgi:hypothetical protein